MSRVPRFYQPGLGTSGETLLSRESSRHALKTLRLKRGDPIRLFDGEGLEVEARILLSEKGRARVEVLRALEAPDRLLPPRVLAFSPPRGERLDLLVEKGTELGATHFQPVLWKRTPPRARSPRLHRLEKIAASACEQCGRARLPRLLPPLPLERFLETGFQGAGLLLDREGPPLEGRDVSGAATLLAGPEGGWEPGEKEAAREAGFLPSSLGPLTLRIETALLAGLSRLALPAEPPGREGPGGSP